MNRLRVLLFIIAVMAVLNVQGQHEVIEISEFDIVSPPMPVEPNVVDPDEVFKVVEVMPEYPGGQVELMKYLASAPYPAEALKNKQEGVVYLSFLVEKDGSVSNVLVSKTSNNEELDKAALEHINAMPIWTPGTQRGRPVRVQYIVPVKFKLDK